MSSSNALPTLYKENAKGKIYEWSIEIIKTSDDGTPDKYALKTSHGEHGGKIKSSIRPVKAKGKKTPKEQAESEALSRWTAKHDKDQYVPDLKHAKNAVVVRPMLAKTFTYESLQKKTKNKIILPAYSQPKLDGARCLASVDSSGPGPGPGTGLEPGSILLQSRTGKKFKFLDGIETDIASLLTGLDTTKYNGREFYFDGELFTRDKHFQEIMSLIKQTTDNKITAEVRRELDKIELWIYDCFDLSHPSLTMKERLTILSDLFEKIGPSNVPHLRLVDTSIVSNEADIRKNYAQAVGDDYEGLILRNMNSPYELDKRSFHLQKLKEFSDAEFKIIGYKESPGEPGIVIWRCTTTDSAATDINGSAVEPGKEFDVVQNGTKAYQRKLFNEADNYIGAWLTVEYFGFTKDGIPRMPKGKDIRLEGI